MSRTRYPRGTVVLVEVMPPHLVASHKAANNFGTWPHNGAVRLLVDGAELSGTLDDNGYDHVVRVATPTDCRAGYDLVL
jgi:hypothetical protein